MNDHIHAAKFMLQDETEPSDIGYRLNETPMAALNGPDGRKYGYPKDVFSNLVDRTGNE